MGYKELLANERSIGEIIKKYNPPIEILIERVKKFATPDEIDGIPCARLYTIFCEYCNENSYSYPHNRQLGLALRLAYGIESKAHRISGVVQKVYFKQENLC